MKEKRCRFQWKRVSEITFGGSGGGENMITTNSMKNLFSIKECACVYICMCVYMRVCLCVCVFM